MDFEGLGTLVVGLLGVLAGAGWLVGRHARRISRLKGEAELVKLLDDSDARVRLREHLEASVVEYVDDQGTISPGWLLAMMVSWLVIAMLMIAGVVDIAFSDDHQLPEWIRFAVVVPAAVLVTSAVRLSSHDSGFVRRRRRSLRRRA